MTLQQKLNDSIITNINIVESENRMCYEYNHLELAESCEKIADEFAIEFAEWCDLNATQKSKGLWYSTPLQIPLWEAKTTKELLEIYKKEIRL